MIVIDSVHHLIDDLIVVRQVLNLMNDAVIVLNLMVHLMNVNLVHVRYSGKKEEKKIGLKIVELTDLFVIIKWVAQFK